MRDQIEAALSAAVDQGVAPAMALGVITAEGERHRWFAGQVQAERVGAPAGPETIFDLASLTKPLTTLLWALRLIEAGAISLETPIGERVAVKDAALGATPLWRLLNHTTGLAAHRPYFERWGAEALRAGDFAACRAAILDEINGSSLLDAPGAVERYSDLGFLILEQALAAVDAPMADRWPTLPGHGLDAIHFRPSLSTPPEFEAHVAPTERCPWRGRWLQGEVHDDNCWTLGGVGGHAGAFGTLDAVLNVAQGYLQTWLGQGAPLGISSELMALTCERRWMHSEGTRVLGWDTPSPGGSSAGDRVHPGAIGHLGFTGTSLWLDPARAVAVVLLTNRVSPSRDNIEIRRFRPVIHDMCWGWIDERRG